MTFTASIDCLVVWTHSNFTGIIKKKKWFFEFPIILGDTHLFIYLFIFVALVLDTFRSVFK